MSEFRVLISAAEASSDLHGAELLRALKEEARQHGVHEVSAIGIGGPKLREAGLHAVYDARDLLSMGFLEVIVRLPKILKGLARITEEAKRFKPQVAIVIDYPDFHFRLSKRLASVGIPMVYYIPPKVWVWRQGRVAALKERFRRILGIFPFETQFFQQFQVPFVYVGNPLLDELPLKMTRDEARAHLGVDERARVLLLMPGSRPSELKFHLEVMLDAALQTATRIEESLTVLIPLPVTAAVSVLEQRISRWKTLHGDSSRLTIRVSQGDSAIAMLAADAGLIKSGTSTLEASVLGCPHAVVYKTGRISAFLFRHVVKYKGPVGLVNLVAAWNPLLPESYRQTNAQRIAREILLEEVTAENLAAEAFSLLTDEERRGKLAGEFQSIREKLAGDGKSLSPSRRAAREVLDVVFGGGKA